MRPPIGNEGVRTITIISPLDTPMIDLSNIKVELGFDG
jgi:hypothetical protein